jgi:hypothetical protein
MIDHDAAEKLRMMLSDIQQKAMSHADAEPGHSLELVEYISLTYARAPKLPKPLGGGN